ncbi:ribosomal protein L30p/L7e [Nitzschia inconspicua]|uniref:Ribosomal protein L30p/L7e n=1 Tax=Nitzschia inconspicua TaxID=303405 RepID=A0A9K3PLR2_9STRA|nr:ribosomal protein L30p/L7e [Nitzschia inconspicua]
MTSNDKHKDLDLVPESVLKRRHDLDDLKRKRQHLEDLQLVGKKNKGGKKGSYVRKPESVLARAKQRRNECIRYNRIKKKGMQKRSSKTPVMKTKEIVEDDNQKVKSISYQANSVGAPYVFCIRIRDDAGNPPRCVRNILNMLRLKEPNTGVFVKYTPTTQRHLHLVEPWVVYGKPSDGVVEDLLERRSYGNVNGDRVPLSDNTIIEQSLGSEHGLICMEDLVHELTGAGELFDVVAKFLWPFPLSASRSEFEKKLLAMKQGKDYGDKGDEIDEYIKQML